MSSIPKTMKAWVVTQAGDPDTALELRTDWPTPESPKGGNIMVKVSCMALNPLDLVVMKYPMLIRGQSIAGADFAGEVIQVGASASVSSDIHLGMTVCGTIPTMQILMGSGGTLAEYIVLPAHMVVEKPKSLGKDAAAGLLGVPGQTCVAILKAASLSKGSRVLVNGASGGVGSVLIQVLQATGIHVTGICSGKNSAMVQRLGAEEVIDYTAHESLYSHLQTSYNSAPFDAILDCRGSEALYRNCPGYLKSGGKFFTIESGLLSTVKFMMHPTMLGGTPRKFVSCMNSPSGESAKVAATWVEKGWIKEIPIDSTYDMDNAVKAYEKLASKHAAGKIIVKVAKQ